MSERAKSSSALGSIQLFTLAFGTIIGVGWITVLGQWISQGGPIGAVVAFLAGAIAIAAVALCYAEVGSMFPIEGGEVAYAEKVFGYSAGVLTGWFLTLAFIVVCGFEAISVGWIFGVLFPQLKGEALYGFAGTDLYAGEAACSLLMLAVVAAFNFRGPRSTSLLQDSLTYFLIIIAASFVVVSFANPEWSNLQPAFGDSPKGALHGFLALLVTTPFWYAGFNVLPQALANRADDKLLPFLGSLMLMVIFAAAAFYCLIIIAACLVEKRSVLLSADLPAVVAFEAAFHSKAWAKASLVVGFAGLLTTWNAIMFASLHVLKKMSAAVSLPDRFNHQNKHGVSYLAFTLVVILTAIMVLVGKSAIMPIINIAGSIFSAMYVLTSLIFLVLRKRLPEASRPYRVSMGRTVGWFAFIFSSALLAIGLHSQYDSRTGVVPDEWTVILVWLVLGLAVIAAQSQTSEKVVRMHKGEM